MSLDVIGGTFPVPAASAYVTFQPYGLGNSTRWSAGKTVVSPLTVNPSLMERWSVLGFSVNLRLGFFPGDTSTSYPLKVWGKFGDLWVGIAPNTSMVADPLNANFPPDLSTFTKVWGGEGAEVKNIPAGNSIDPTLFSIIAQTYMLPVPLRLRSGSQLAMGIVLTPSLIGWANEAPGPTPTNIPLLALLSCTYTVIYDDGRQG